MLPRLPFDRNGPLAEPAQLALLRIEGPLHRVRTAVGDEAWLAIGPDLVRDLLDDDRLGRSHPDPARAARTGESALFGGPMGDFATEKADHARMRALLRPHFSPGRVRGLAPRVAELTTGLLDDMEHGPRPADLVQALAVPLPVLVICELLGVPYADREDFRAWTRDAADTADRARSERGLAELFAYGLDLVARKRRTPGDDVVSRLAADPDVGEQEAAVLAMVLLFAGHETTVTQIGLGLLGLLASPGQWHALVREPGRVDGAVEELLRAPSRSGGGIPRYACTDMEVAGRTVRTGDLVLCDTDAADHDPERFPDPYRFDAARAPNAHLAFGHGIRYCLGAPLARLELRAVLSGLIERMPGLELAVAPEQVRVREDVLTGGPVALLVRW
ncbi:cytochrome P450 [Nocardiopsis dassonvillei]|uniref:cytochrome P450 n=1 Tax=Nocardiopsis dassonvillei TaxID=2014 RepID=UPI003F574324